MPTFSIASPSSIDDSAISTVRVLDDPDDLTGTCHGGGTAAGDQRDQPALSTVD
jgi:hypothetical protein